jgi:hypothetical protein
MCSNCAAVIADTNAERGLGAVFIASVVGFGAWLYGMEVRTAKLAEHLAEIGSIGVGINKGAKAMRRIARNTQVPEKKDFN